MKFKVGQVWKDGRGRRCVITEVRQEISDNEPIGVKILDEGHTKGVFWHRRDGKYGMPEFSESLVEFVSESEVTVFAKGQIWETKSGFYCKIREISKDFARPILIDYIENPKGAMPSFATGTRTKEGLHSADPADPLNLIKLISPQQDQTPEAIDDCECRKKKFGFIGHMQYCPDFNVSMRAWKREEITMDPNVQYMTQGDSIAMSDKRLK